MKIARFLSGTRERLGLHLEDGIIDLDNLIHILPDDQASLKEALLNWLLQYPTTDWGPIGRLMEWYLQLSKKNDIEILPTASVTYLPPVAAPGKIVCIGKNYPGIQKEVNREYPTIFLKANSTMTGHQHPIEIPSVSQQVFCEPELALVIGKQGKHIPEDQVWDYISGFTIANDVGALDLENRTTQWQTGKLPDSFLPLGPVLVSPDEIGDANKLQITLKINEQLVIDDNTNSMNFSIPEIISYVSSIATLFPGDLILTGSPKPIQESGLQRCFIQSSDVVDTEIEQIGLLTNPVIKEVNQ